MDPGKSEFYEFLDLSDIEENERRQIKHTLYSGRTPDFLQLPWTNNTSPEWQPQSYGNGAPHVPNGPADQSSAQASGMVADRGAPSLAHHVPIVTMFSQPPVFTMPPSTGYQHPPSVFVSSVTPNMHPHVTNYYMQPHFNMEPDRGHRGRPRGRGKRNDVRMDAPPMEANSPGYAPQYVPYQYHPAYYQQPSPMQHPNAQHATGSPLYIAPMYPPMYSTYPAPQYYTPPAPHLMEDANTEINEMPEPRPIQPVYQHQTSEEEYESNVVTTTVIVNSNMLNSYVKPNNLINNNNIVKVEELSAVPEVQAMPVMDMKPPVEPEIVNTVHNNSASVIDSSVEETDPKVKSSVNSMNVNPRVPEPLSEPAPVHSSPDMKPSVDSQETSAPQTEMSKSETQDTFVPVSSKSWASLFVKPNSDTSPEKSQITVSKSNIKLEKVDKKLDDKCMQINASNIDKSIYSNPSAHRIGEFLSKYSLNNRTVSLQPRGLTNRSNYCYINSILQALLACPPFYNLLKALPYQSRKNTSQKSPTPIMDTMFDFVNEFTPVPVGARLNRKEKGQRKEDNTDILCGISFEPSRIYKILNGIRSDTFIVEGRQEDAEEFFGCLLNGLNDEMLELMKLVQNDHMNLSNGDIATNGDSHEDKEEWKVMGPKNKGSITRRAELGRTPISDIFRGQLCSRVVRPGNQVTDNVQPFFTLQLDIEKATSVCEALEMLILRDRLEGVTCSRTNQQVEAYQHVILEELPLVMVLHLKCFNYKLDACSKIIKAVEFPIDLKIDSKLLSAKAKHAGKQKQYKLFAVVYHEGREANKGHYLTDAYHAGCGGWVRYDDANVRAVQETQVLHPSPTQVPYLLFYRRADTIGNQQMPTPKKD